MKKDSKTLLDFKIKEDIHTNLIPYDFASSTNKKALELKKRKEKRIEDAYSFLLSELDDIYDDLYDDSEYGFFNTIGNIGSGIKTGAIGAGSLLGIPGARNAFRARLKSSATKVAMNKVSGGVAGIAGAKLGVDQGTIKGLIDGAGQMTGITQDMHQGLTQGFEGTKLGKFGSDVSKGAGEMWQGAKNLGNQAAQKMGFTTNPASTSPATSTNPPNTNQGGQQLSLF